jgi:hypothetical protein
MFRRPYLLAVLLGLAAAALGLGACAARIVDDTNGPSAGGGASCSCPTCCGQELCPRFLPSDGDACNQIDLVCVFDVPGACPSTFTCVDGAWRAGPPRPGSSCSVAGQTCDYASGSPCGGVTATCAGGAWNVSSGQDGGACCDGSSCCAAITCPPSPPTAGAACAAEPPCDPTIACQYPAPCDATATLTATCPGGTWQLDAPTDCGCVGATHAQCTARPACRWIGPACGGGPTVAQPMCEPVAGCTSPSDCPAGYDCAAIAVDPCPGGQCGSCSIVVPECLPQQD